MNYYDIKIEPLQSAWDIIGYIPAGGSENLISILRTNVQIFGDLVMPFWMLLIIYFIGAVIILKVFF